MKIAGVKHTFEQDEDCCGRDDSVGQFLDVETCDGGGGSYLVLTTERWAIDDVDEFAAWLRSVLALVEPPTKEPLPTPAELRGIDRDFTGGEESVSYVRRGRGGEGKAE